jgi:hypothetical protein
MKSIMIWLFAFILGGTTGYMIGYYFGLNVYLWAGLGVIIGSSAGITLNIHRSRDKPFISNEAETNHSNSE